MRPLPPSAEAFLSPPAPRPSPARFGAAAARAIDQGGQVATPGGKETVHVEDVIRADRRRLGRSIGGTAVAVETPRDDEPEGGAQAPGAVDLDEGKIVTPGKEADAGGWDAVVADGAAETVREGDEVVQRIHPRRV